MDGMNGDYGDNRSAEVGIYSQQEKSRKSRPEGSDDSDYHDSDSDGDDSDVYDSDASGRGDENLANPRCVDDDDDDIAPDFADRQGEQLEALIGYHKNLTRGTLMKHASKERLLQDPGSGIFLVDGDSLILEAMGTKSWKYGQQLHLFYIIETCLNHLSRNGAAKFEIVFFKAMEKIWYKDVFGRASRVALIYHLEVNCKIKVHSEWEDSFSPQWLDYLKTENPSFIFVHDGYHEAPPTNIALKVLMYNCLSDNIDVAFTTDVHNQSSKLYAVLVKSLAAHSNDNNKAYLTEAWICLQEFYTDNVTTPEFTEMSEIVNLKDKVFLESVLFYWDGLSGAEKNVAGGGVNRRVNRWCRYFAVLSRCTLAERIRIAREDSGHTYKDKVTEDSELFKFISSVLQSLNAVPSHDNYDDPESVADILDLALYSQLFDCESLSNFTGSKEVEDKYLVLLELARTKLVGINIEAENAPAAEKTEDDSASGMEAEESALIAIKSRLTEEYAGNVKETLDLDESDSTLFDEVDEFDVCDDVMDWLSNEPLKDDIDRKAAKSISKVPYIRMRQLKEIQKFNDFLAVYGQAFEGFTEPTMITKNENKNKENKKTEKVKQKQKPGKKQVNKKSMKDAIIEENNKKKLEEAKQRVGTQWKSKKGEIEEVDDSALAISKVSDFIDKYDTCKIGYEEPISFLMQLQHDTWKKNFADDNRSMSNLAELIHTMHTTLQNDNIASDNMKVKIIKYFKRIGFEDASLLVTQTLTDGKKVEKIGKSTDKCSVSIPYNVFQMRFMGHLMKRQVRTDPDPRVAGFIPDTWQRDLLDVVDKNESAVIVAPTSSGKTFCSFYCMEKVLRESDTGVVVYVSPTKALVNQILASIYARYKKNMPAGTTLVGTFTRDYQHNALTSQILVTVPQCLEMLLLSPKRQQWAARLKYVIFDEVHCIGGELGGEVWEHLLTLVRCPFLALSATIGNPDFFHSWLRCVNRFKEQQFSSQGGGKSGKDGASMKYSVKLVVHNERYSDINKAIYVPENDEIVDTHPCMFLDADFLCTKGFPSAFSLSPNEAFELWMAGKTAFKDDADKMKILDDWCPVKYFGKQLYITKENARAYEISLKEKLTEMIKEDTGKAQFLIEYFRDKMPVSRHDDKGFQIPGVSEKEFDLYETFPLFIEKLRKEDKLPVIVFMNDRRGVEKLTQSLSKHVDRKIHEVRSKMSQIHSRQSEADKIAKKSTKSRKNVDSEGEEIEDHMGDYLKGETNRNKLQIQKKENACKFVKQSKLTLEEREKLFTKSSKAGEKSMLENGIGFHHEGCDAGHKRAVEYLFLSQYAQVVAATRTLALGIHFPCRTVVFVGDDHFVDSLNYRQMSGRSGRRGFDNLGNVVFYGVPLPKISKLIRADISTLEGQFPVNCTVVLRLLILVANCTDSDDAHKKAMAVLSHPFITHQSQSVQNQLKYYFLFVAHFLMRQALIDNKGTPLAFSGLVSHLHYDEPANFVFVNLLKSGVFHDICKPSKASEPGGVTFGVKCKKCNSSPIVGQKFTCGKCFYDYSLCSKCFTKANHKIGREEHTGSDFVESPAEFKYTYSEDTLTQLLSILCHIFCKEKIPNMRLKMVGSNNAMVGSNVCTLRGKPALSKVILDPLPGNIQKALQEYNESVQSIFGNYLSTVSKSIPRDVRVTLPISKKSWKVSHGGVPLPNDASAVDPFVQLSGCSNADVKSHCLDSEQIRRIMPKEIYMDINFIPSLSLGSQKNAYPLDFFTHGSRTAIERDNWMAVGKIYDNLNDFKLAIGKISVAMEQLAPEDGDDHVIWAFKHLSYEYNCRFKKAFKVKK